MPEEVRANITQLNQQSKKHLLNFKQNPSPNHLYCLQLAKWAMEENKMSLHWRADSLEEHLDKMLFRGNQEKVGQFLEADHDLMNGAAQNQSPEDLAQEILQHLHDRLTETSESYS